MSTDELTGVQALERKRPGLPMAPGKVERREFEYIRHGTLFFILADPTHRIVFHFTPKHCSWLNRIEIWLSIPGALWARKLLRRGSFRSLHELKNKVFDFIDSYNPTMANPFKWTYQGKPLLA